LNFLIQNNLSKRLELQLLGFLETKKIAVSQYVGIPNTTCDTALVTISDIAKSTIPSIRFGKRVEYFFSYLLLANDYKIIAHGLQLIDKRTTLGELDFIVFHKKLKHYIHIEITNKFYLYDPEKNNEITAWIGPNRRDSLQEKLTKLKEKQFPLLFSKTGLDILKSRCIDPLNIVQQLDFRAQLFVPYKIQQDKPVLFQEAIMGFYVNLDMFRGVFFAESTYFIPAKEDWQVAAKHGEIWFDYETVLTRVSQIYFPKKQSPMLWVKTREGHYHKIFVVWW